MRKLKKQLANILTCLRIAGSAVLLFLSPLTVEFFAVYALCGLTDMVDGAVARGLNSTSRLGETLDSIADIVFVTAAAIRLLPQLWQLLSVQWLIPVAAIASIKLASAVYGLVKLRKPCFLHTAFNKAAGMAAFLLPFFYRLQFFPVLAGVVCAFAFFAALHELVCVIKRVEV